jgi:hypothetical protein
MVEGQAEQPARTQQAEKRSRALVTRKDYSPVMKMEAERSSEKSVTSTGLHGIIFQKSKALESQVQ